MDFVMEEYDLKDFEGLIGLLMRNFPDFWTKRLAEGKYSFPYDLRLFVLRDRSTDQLVGTIGVHDYKIQCGEETLLLGGVCDVGVDPDYRQRGLAKKMLSFLLDLVRNDKRYAGMALYTEKPWAYLSSGFALYTPLLPEKELIREEDPAQEWISLAGLKKDDPLRKKVITLYEAAPAFNGKCVRSSKTWEEIFEEKSHFFCVKSDSCILRKDNKILESYSGSHAYCDSGSFEEHIIMTLPFDQKGTFARLVRERSLLFPVADTF